MKKYSIIIIILVSIFLVSFSLIAGEETDNLIDGIERAYASGNTRGLIKPFADRLIRMGSDATGDIIRELKAGRLSKDTETTLCYILGVINDKTIYPDLIPLLTRKDLSASARIRISKLLEKWNIPEAGPTMIDLVRDEDEERNLRIVNIGILGKWQDPSALNTLIDIAMDAREESFVRYKAVQMLERYDDSKASDSLIGLLEKPRPLGDPVIERAVISVGNKREIQAVPALVRLAEDEAVGGILRKRSILALGKIGSDSAVMPLKKLLSDENAIVRKYSAQALKKITGEETQLLDRSFFEGRKASSSELLYGPRKDTE